MKKILFYSDDETKRKLLAVAGEEGGNMSASIRRMIHERYDELFVSIPKIGNISAGGIKKLINCTCLERVGDNGVCPIHGERK